MAFILNIDTALSEAQISLASNGETLATATNSAERDHAAWLHPAVIGLMENSGVRLKDLSGIGIMIGPGSFTGLRIGLSAAKGLCYSLRLPLLAVGTLEAMALSAVKHMERADAAACSKDLLYCPMIDARRMEVFTAVYTATLEERLPPRAITLAATSFCDLLKRQKILFLGNGSEKFRKICQDSSAIFEKVPVMPFALAALTYKNFIGNNFAELAYTEPLYIKEFFARQADQP